MGYRVNLGSDLRHRGLLRRLGTGRARDDLDQYPAEPETVASVWCAVVPQTGSLLTGRPAETELARTTHKIILRYRPDVTEDMWVEVYGVRYDILYVLDPYHDRRTLELFCEVRRDGSEV